jgi:hypothetical protein
MLLDSARTAALIGGLVLATAGAGPLSAQDDLLARVDRTEVQILTELAGGDASLAGPGSRAAEILERGRAFRREVIAILADPDISDHAAALEAAIARYRSRPEVALTTAPKNMDVLYSHEGALAFRTERRDLNGPLWSGHWLHLAITEPYTDLPPGPDRAAALDTVEARYRAKLDRGDAPNDWPTELPLAPAIAPGLVWASPEAAIVWDNLSMLTEVVADILAAPDIDDRRARIDAAVDFFTDPSTGLTPQLMWETMALRHGIFFQGGFPLAVMTRSERNRDSHAAHMRSGAPMVMPGMSRGPGG